ncbi:hypothetical protein [Pseudonocardia abyssalis]|uniref:Uncharacterized protein n=1 Tax=Pseudonocardia abyssalis TaxID=2792008 RepID=A0ABS6V141_9PSEU|nr:hypothetical protein [Pseudonocardia abyssalis]MBW0116251.1 hypothetical protein [Pseudonocardia abyssalis]MBW0138232.1 hypothetical protein [Pseudonocardia abyssalis]
MPPDPFVTTHIHTDGPIPGPHSLLTLTSAAFTGHGVLISTFTANVRELPGATLHPIALSHWRARADDWLHTRRASRPPAPAMIDYTRWIEKLAGTPSFVADPARADYVFVYWYLQRFIGHWPFADTLLDPVLHDRLDCSTLCSLASCRVPLAS